MAREVNESNSSRPRTGGVIHTYRGYDPKRFPYAQRRDARPGIAGV